ncbi:hypothetical protein VD0002_g7782 [Verticillium dahliae]|uniref:M protein, serotype 2.1 n=1 Tax=Verticillium dahliae TaxID=27337 RepID=A0AA44WED9_VERDA|nr:hypothetical protein BJF96_g7007 [Verticillium dahliae]PNH50712.1 hypothetical protein VD0003_g6477 [Verticillium dahliae]PNH59796.1 hypothetical protein VD0002_g7782 [Verticillium dahliae]
MSAATAKKPPAAGVGRVASTDPTASPSSSPARSAHRSTPSVSGAGGAGAVSRTRSTRTGTPTRPVAGRKDSPLNSATDADQDARAELVTQLEDLKERLSKAEISAEQYRKQAEVLQTRLDDALEASAKLEEKVHENEELAETLRNEKRDAARQMREMEAIYEAERSSMNKEKEDMANREEEMQMVIQRLKDSLAQRANNDDDVRPSRQPHSPSVEGGFAPPSSLNRSDSRNNSKLLLQKDKLIESLRLELAEAQIKLVESENSGGGRLHEVERLLMEARMANARLMEDNESYQLLLQEKTLSGEFNKNDFSYMGSSAANQDALNALEGRTAGTSLADELSDAAGTDNDGEAVRRLESEIKASKDQNKALTLYINKIIERLLQHQDFEHILDQSGSDLKLPGAANVDKELPPPPADKGPVVPSFLQRAKSMAVGSGKPRPRPMSVMPTSGYSAHEDPETAPRIPIGNLTRSTSTRRSSRPVSEQYTGGGGASLVNQMYRGADGPVSPGLGNPRHSQSFFTTASGGGGGGGSTNPNAAARAPSQQSSAGNFPGMRSETSSISGDSASVVNGSSAGGDVSTPPSQSSPPRSHHEKSTTFAGNKPRPLRLVQEAEATKTETANKRASWMGWAAGWGKKDQQPDQQPQQPPTPATPTVPQRRASGEAIPE